MKLSEDEIAIIEGMRQEKAIWNAALEEALSVISMLPESAEKNITAQRVMDLRKL
jgi:hypothetical protein